MDKETQRKWDAASRTFDLFSFAEDRRLGPHKRRLFANMQGATRVRWPNSKAHAAP